MAEIVSLAEVRAARAARAAQVTAQPQVAPLCWSQSARGNWWTKDARSGLHLVIYETRRGWSGRATTPDGRGWFVNLPADVAYLDVASLAAAQAWAEG
jgi:hypothetical protein